jgi:putative endonuclease
MVYYVYIIRSKSSKKYYTGMTSSILRRLQEHNQRLSNTRTTKYFTDYELLFYQEVENRINARKLEKYLKSGTGREIRNEIIEEIFGIVAQPG